LHHNSKTLKSGRLKEVSKKLKVTAKQPTHLMPKLQLLMMKETTGNACLMAAWILTLLLSSASLRRWTSPQPLPHIEKQFL